MVRQRSAKPLFAGSNPAVASIETPPGFNFEVTVVSHGWYKLAPFRWDGDVLHRVELLDGTPRQLAIAWRHGSLSVRARGATLNDELHAKLTRMFQLDVAIEEFHALAAESRTHAWAAGHRFGRLLCGSTLFEDAVKIIATKNTTWRQTVRMIELLVRHAFEPLGQESSVPTAHQRVRR